MSAKREITLTGARLIFHRELMSTKAHVVNKEKWMTETEWVEFHPCELANLAVCPTMYYLLEPVFRKSFQRWPTITISFMADVQRWAARKKNAELFMAFNLWARDPARKDEVNAAIGGIKYAREVGDARQKLSRLEVEAQAELAHLEKVYKKNPKN